jgi:hypothetical protein
VAAMRDTQRHPAALFMASTVTGWPICGPSKLVPMMGLPCPSARQSDNT